MAIVQKHVEATTSRDDAIEAIAANFQEWLERWVNESIFPRGNCLEDLLSWAIAYIDFPDLARHELDEYLLEHGAPKHWKE
jgi:hypothetical protein